MTNIEISEDSNLLPTSTSCQPPPLANLYLLPTSISCQPPPLANFHLLPTSTSSQYPSLLNPRALTRALAREGATSLFYITLEDFSKPLLFCHRLHLSHEPNLKRTNLLSSHLPSLLPSHALPNKTHNKLREREEAEA